MRLMVSLAAVRNRAQVKSSGLRKPEMLPPPEVREAVVRVVTANCGAKIDDVIVATSRALGLAATSAQFRETLERQIYVVLDAGTLESRDGKLYPTEHNHRRHRNNGWLALSSNDSSHRDDFSVSPS